MSAYNAFHLIFIMQIHYSNDFTCTVHCSSFLFGKFIPLEKLVWLNIIRIVFELNEADLFHFVLFKMFSDKVVINSLPSPFSS